MLVDDAEVDIGETNIRIVKLSKAVLVDCLLELVLVPLGDHLECVVDEFQCFVVDKEFASLLGRSIDGNVIRVLAGVEWWLKRVIEVLDIECFRHHDA